MATPSNQKREEVILACGVQTVSEIFFFLPLLSWLFFFNGLGEPLTVRRFSSLMRIIGGFVGKLVVHAKQATKCIAVHSMYSNQCYFNLNVYF